MYNSTEQYLSIQLAPDKVCEVQEITDSLVQYSWDIAGQYTFLNLLQSSDHFQKRHLRNSSIHGIMGISQAPTPQVTVWKTTSSIGRIPETNRWQRLPAQPLQANSAPTQAAGALHNLARMSESDGVH